MIKFRILNWTDHEVKFKKSTNTYKRNNYSTRKQVIWEVQEFVARQYSVDHRIISVNIKNLKGARYG